MDEVLKLNDVSYTYKNAVSKVTAVKNVNASFENGKLYAITGRSGSGKTTLMSLMAGLDQVDKGSIEFMGKSLKSLDRDKYRSRSIGMIFQSYNLLPQLTALENVMLVMEDLKTKRSEQRKRALELLENVGIEGDKAHRKVLKLSGGEQQRVAIARALATDPPLILADEPTGNLDSETGDKVIEILKALAHEYNKCLIMITHSKSIAKQADKMFGMKDGVMTELILEAN